MAILFDTGVLLRAFNRNDPVFADIRISLEVLRRQQNDPYVAVQNIAEFWDVATRLPEVNGLGWPLEKARRRLDLVERFATTGVLTENSESYKHWKRLVDGYSIQGVAVHDCRLVSVMLAKGIPRILTLNLRDFKRDDEIEAVTPAMLAQEL